MKSPIECLAIHHAAGEETVLLPDAERVPKSELHSLGAAMTRRRMQQLGERPMDIVVDPAGTFPPATLLLSSALLFALRHCLPRSSRTRRGRRLDERCYA